MKSPFAIFRKHQKVLMVSLTGLAMFAFVISDSFRADSSSATLPILFGVAGMAILGYIGWRRGEAITFGALGIVIGVVVGVFIMLHSGSGPKPPIETDAGNLSHNELNNLISRRNTANQFVKLAIEKADFTPAMQNNPMFAQILEQQISRSLFGFGLQQEDLNADVVRGYLLDKEADEMGIVVSEHAVSDYINRITNKKLTSTDFNSVIKSMRLSESEVFDAIRGELRARLAMQMLIPRSVPSPDEYWNEYRKLQVSETLDVAAVPVTDFLSAAPNPTEDQLLTYFDAWKEGPATFPGSPGLRQPRRVRVEYLQADFTATEKEVGKQPITDQEIKKYYDDHHEEYRNHPAATSTPTSPSGPTLPLPGATKAPAGRPAPVQKNAAPGKNGVSPPAKSAPQKTDAKPNSKSGTFNDRKPLRPTQPEGEMLALADWRTEPIQLAAADEFKEPSAPALPKPPAAQSGTIQSGTIQSGTIQSGTIQSGTIQSGTIQSGTIQSGTIQSGTTQSQVTPSGTTPAAKQPPTKPVGGKPAGGKPAGAKPDATKPTDANSIFSSTTKTPEGPEPEFRPLDEILKREIHEQILRARTQAAMKVQIEAAFDFLQSLREQLNPAEIGGVPKMSADERKKVVSEYAAKHQLVYVLTPLLSAEELHNSAEKYPIADATEPVEDQFQQRQPVQVMQVLFLSSPELLYEPYRADEGESHRFAYWKVEDLADHVPTLKDPGVREQAVRGWKIAEFAQKKAKERADALADIVRKSKQGMPEALAGQKVTSSDRGPAVVVVPTPPFSWYTVQSTAPRDLMPDPAPRLSEITGVTSPDEAFMKAVFDEMKVGDVRVVPNLGPTAYYVVSVKTRHPADDAEKEAFRARFMKERLFGSGFMFGGRTTYDYLNLPQQQQLVGDWMQRLYTKYNVHENKDEAPTNRRNTRRAM